MPGKENQQGIPHKRSNLNQRSRQITHRIFPRRLFSGHITRIGLIEYNQFVSSKLLSRIDNNGDRHPAAHTAVRPAQHLLNTLKLKTREGFGNRLILCNNFIVSIDISTRGCRSSSCFRRPSITGTTRSSSAWTVTAAAPGRVDSPPTSMISAPSSAISMPRAIARSALS